MASDHAGVERREVLATLLKEAGHEVYVFGPQPDETGHIAPATHAVHVDEAIVCMRQKECDFALLICGSGQGMAMRANRYPGIRAALVQTVEMAKLARAHNNANVLCMGARVMDEPTARACLKAFMETPFEGGRHIPRNERLDAPLI